MPPLIALTTDFGPAEVYVGIMKGVILGINPQATIVDLCHTIEPQAILQGAFLLGGAAPHFPQGTIHVAVVDPDVGGPRRPILLGTPRAHFLAPDNGLLSYILEAEVREEGEGGLGVPMAPVPGQPELQLRAVPQGCSAVVLTQPRYWLHPLSATFHGRDIFAPVAAHLSLGVAPENFGEATGSLWAFPLPRPLPLPNGGLQCHVLHIDRFGNLITNARQSDLPQGELVVGIKERWIRGLSPFYAAGGELLALIDSAGFLEIAAKNGSAARFLGAGVGEEVRVMPARAREP